MAAENTIYLITGTTRGIGLALVKHYLSLPHNTVICGVRDPSASAAKDLLSLSTGEGSKAILVKLDASSATTDAANLVKTLESEHGITHIDLLIPNAAIFHTKGDVKDISPEALLDHMSINTAAPLELFRATRPLLLKSQKGAKFIPISAESASFTRSNEFLAAMAAYNASKAALNHLTIAIHLQEPALVSFPLNPGVVYTNMSLAVLPDLSKEKAKEAGINLLTAEESAVAMASVIGESTREKTGGHFMNYDGSVIPW